MILYIISIIKMTIFRLKLIPINRAFLVGLLPVYLTCKRKYEQKNINFRSAVLLVKIIFENLKRHEHT